MAEGEVAGRLEIPVVGDLSDFRKNLRAKVEAAAEGIVAKVKAELDTDQLREELEVAVEEAAAGVKARIGVEVDRRGVRRAVEEAADEAKGDVEVPVTGRNRLRDRLRAWLLEAQIKADADPVEVPVTGENRLRSRLKLWMAEAQAEAKKKPIKIPFVSGGKGGLGIAGRPALYLGIASLIQPLIALIGQGGAGLLAMAGNLGRVVNVFGALPSLLTGLGTAAFGVVLGFKGISGQASSLVPEARKVRAEVSALNPAFTKLKNTAASELWGQLVGKLKPLADRVLPVLNVRVAESNRIMGVFLGRTAEWASTNQFATDLNTVMRAGNRLLRSLLNTTSGLVKAWMDLAVAGAPFLDRLGKGAEKFGEWAAQEAKAARENGTFLDYLNRGADAASQWGRILRNVGSGILSWFRAAGDAGQSLTDSLEGVTANWAEIMKSPERQASIKKFMEDALPAVREMGKIIAGLGRGLVRMSVDPNLTANLEKIRTELGPALERFLTNLGQNLGPKLIDFISGLAEALANLSEAGGPLSKLVTVLDDIVDAFNSLNDRFPTVGKAIGGFLGSLVVLKGLGFIVKKSGLATLIGLLGKANKLGAGKGATGGLIGLLLKGGKSKLLTQLASKGGLLSLLKGGAKGLKGGGPLGAIASIGSGVVGSAIKDGKGGGRDALGGAISGAGTGAALGATIGSIVPGLGTGIGAAVGAAVGGIGGALSSSGVRDKVLAWSKSAFSSIKDEASRQWEAVKSDAVDMWHGVQDAWDSLAGAASTAWNAVSGAVSSAWDAVTGAVQTGVSKVADWMRTAWDTVTGAVATAWNGIVNTITSIWSAVSAPIMTVWNIVSGLFLLGFDILRGIVEIGWTILSGLFGIGFEVIKGIVSVAWAVVSGLFRLAFAGMQAVVSVAVNVVLGLWRALWGGITAVASAIASVVRVAWGAISAATTAVWDFISGKVAAVWNAIKGAVSAAINFVLPYVTAAWNFISGVTSTVWDAISSKVSSVWNAIKGAVSAALALVRGWISAAWGFVSGKTTATWDSISAKISAVWTAIKNAVSTALNFVRNIVQSVWNKVTSIIQGAINTARSVVNGGVDGIKSRIQSGMESARRAVANAFDRIVSAIRSKIGDATSLVRGLPGRITSALGDLGSLLYRSGQKVVSGLIDGIMSKVRAVANAASRVAQAVRDHFPFSPAKAGPLRTHPMDKAGSNIVRMLHDGMAATRPKVTSLMREIAGDVAGQDFSVSSLRSGASSRLMRATGAQVVFADGAVRIQNPAPEPASESVNSVLRKRAAFGMFGAA